MTMDQSLKLKAGQAGQRASRPEKVFMAGALLLFGLALRATRNRNSEVDQIMKDFDDDT